MKKILCFILAAVIFISVLASCAENNGKNETDDPNVLTEAEKSDISVLVNKFFEFQTQVATEADFEDREEIFIDNVSNYMYIKGCELYITLLNAADENDYRYIPEITDCIISKKDGIYTVNCVVNVDTSTDRVTLGTKGEEYIFEILKINGKYKIDSVQTGENGALPPMTSTLNFYINQIFGCDAVVTKENIDTAFEACLKDRLETTE